MSSPATDSDHESPQALLEKLEKETAAKESLLGIVARLEGRLATLEMALVHHASENELLRRRLYGTKSERGGTDELQLTLGDILSEKAALQKQLRDALDKQQAELEQAGDMPDKGKTKTSTPKGRRDLSASQLPRVVVELRDEDVERAGGKLVDWESSFELMHQSAAWKVLEKKHAKYEVVVQGEAKLVGTAAPKRVLTRGMLHTSAVAYLCVQKFGLGVPHHRLEQHLSAQGEGLDRTTMGRNVTEVGHVLGATVVAAMFRDATLNCQVLSTDATGAAIQPGASESGGKQACKKGHFFTVVADCDHVLFHYAEKHTKDAVSELFKGFRGFLQADASSVYDILETGPPNAAEPNGVSLVGCWAHCRRYFFEAAICKYPVGVEGLMRIRAVYAADNMLASLPPSKRLAARARHVAPLIADFFQWAKAAAQQTTGRSLATKALGYALNQETELRRVLLDGRLPLDNTRSERALRTIVVGRKNWLFYGSDDHAEAAAALFSVIASCRLHGLDPEAYIDELLRVLPYWPIDRNLELAPKYWRATRARLDPEQLAAPIGVIDVPPLAG